MGDAHILTWDIWCIYLVLKVAFADGFLNAMFSLNESILTALKIICWFYNLINYNDFQLSVVAVKVPLKLYKYLSHRAV